MRNYFIPQLYRLILEERIKLANYIKAGLRFDLPKAKKNDLLSRIIEAKRLNWKPKTICAYTTVANYFLKWLGKKKPESVKSQDINDYLIKQYELLYGLDFL